MSLSRQSMGERGRPKRTSPGRNSVAEDVYYEDSVHQGDGSGVLLSTQALGKGEFLTPITTDHGEMLR